MSKIAAPSKNSWLNSKTRASCHFFSLKGILMTNDNKTQFKLLRLGEGLPRGWIKQQMLDDLRHGFAARLDDISPRASSRAFTDNHVTSVEASDTERALLVSISLFRVFARSCSTASASGVLRSSSIAATKRSMTSSWKEKPGLVQEDLPFVGEPRLKR